jgi:NDP-sugar pyrophosphorylase family protein
MDLFIPSAGLGKRLRPITNYIPKPLIKIRGEENLLRIIKKFKKVDTIIVNVSYLGDKIINFLRLQKLKNLSIYKETEPLGVIGGLYNAFSVMKRNDIFVHNSDIYFDGGIDTILKSGGDLVLGLVKNGTRDVLVNDNGEIIKIANYSFNNGKGSKWYGYSGIMLIRRRVLRFFSDFHKRGKYLTFINDFIKILNEKKMNITGVVLSGVWSDFGSIDKLDNFRNFEKTIDK